MNQEEMRQRLIDLIEQPMPMMCGTVTYGEMRMPEYQARFIVNNLIANGVTIRERGEWQPNYETFVDYAGIETEPIQTGWVCSVCGEHDNNYPFCPHCGADMRGVKDE